jgi:2-oxoglutarate dehydrogenase E2 component (dihydrolipoamide succinyltransferase)
MTIASAPITFSAEQQEGTQSIISQWFKKIGDRVKENEPLVEVSTDKVNVEIASPASGVLTEILKKDGDQLAPGEVLGTISLGEAATTGAAAGAKPATSAPRAEAASSTSASAPSSASQDLSPAVRKLLKEHNLQASQITGTGKGGRITHEDVSAFLASRTSGTESSNSASTATALASRKVPHTPMRKQIAHHMSESLMRVAPHVTSIFECDLSSVMAHRDAHKVEFEKKGVRLTFTSYFVVATAKALQAVPEVNSRFHEDALEIFDDCNIGVAVALEPGKHSDSGLIVPVIHHAQKRSLFEVAAELQQLTEKAKAGTIAGADVKGGTFTISNHGVSGSLVAAPIIINQPQSAILGIGKLEKRPAVVTENGKDTIQIRPRMYVTLTLDHRVLDGFKANAFLSTFVETLEGQWV